MSDELEREISAAIGTNRFLDPPDGGAVTLAEQVQRMRQALDRAERECEGWRENLQSAWAALRMIREALETLGPVGALPSEEAVLQLRGPTFHDEAATLVEAIQRLASPPTALPKFPSPSEIEIRDAADTTIVPRALDYPNAWSVERTGPLEDDWKINRNEL